MHATERDLSPQAKTNVQSPLLPSAPEARGDPAERGANVSNELVCQSLDLLLLNGCRHLLSFPAQCACLDSFATTMARHSLYSLSARVASDIVRHSTLVLR